MPILTVHQSKQVRRNRSLVRNTLINLIGQGAPLLIAFFTIPLLIQGLGTDRFGILTLAWALMGYFSIFDLGLGRALTQVVAEKLGGEKYHELPATIWTASLLMLGIGLAGSTIVILISPWIVHNALNIPATLQPETLLSFFLLACSIPIVISTAAFRGVLEAHQRFGIVNVVRVCMGLFTFTSPLLVLPFSNSLFAVVIVLIVGRIINWITHIIICLRIVPALTKEISFSKIVFHSLIRFGSWLTVTNIVGPLMISLDRFIIGAFVSMAAVAYYVTPYEMVTKLSIIPSSLVIVLFPNFAITFAQNKDRTKLFYSTGMKYIFITLFPIILTIVTFSHEGILFWLGKEFVQYSTPILQWLAIGVFFNGLAQIPYTLIQGVGRPDLAAKLHLLELPLYLLALWWLLQAYGIVGAAIGWTARSILDAILLFYLAQRLLPMTRQQIRHVFSALVLTLVIFALATAIPTIPLKALFLLLTMFIFPSVVWIFVLSPEERSLLYQRLSRLSLVRSQSL